MLQTYLQVDARDNVLVALQDLPEGEKISFEGHYFQLQEKIPEKHKFTLNSIEKGEHIRMYGVIIGKALQTIPIGSKITINNTIHDVEDYSTKDQKIAPTLPSVDDYHGLTFQGYHRKDGSVGTMNYWLVIPLVFCENRNIEIIKNHLSEALGYGLEKDFTLNIQALIEQYKIGASDEDILNTSIIQSREEVTKNRLFPNVDGIQYLIHNGGCGSTPQDTQALCRLLAGYILNPNVAGATVLSLGCQHAQTHLLQEAIFQIQSDFSKPLYLLDHQESGTEQAFLEKAIKYTFLGLKEANNYTRQPAPLSKLVLGLECGGSDGFSGISANPALGHTSDLLVALGGSALLSEFPELNGVEQELINRCQNEELANKFTHLMSTYSQRAIAVGSGFENNPSPGNIKDGLITDAMKSAGAAKKGGTSVIMDVLDYGEVLQKNGLNLLCTPGNDVESTTGLAGAGANIIVFTTGLGTPTGNPICPVIKMSTNTTLFKRMGDIIDFDAGPIITGQKDIKEIGKALLEYIIEVASGRATPAAVRLGQHDFIPWKRGISL